MPIIANKKSYIIKKDNKYYDFVNLFKRATLTVSPSPADAIVTLTADGYTQSGNSITVIKGTTVSWSVSKNTYTTQSGQFVVNSNETKYVELQLAGPLYRCYTGELSKYVYIDPNDTTKAYVYSKDVNSAASSSSELVEYSSTGFRYSVASVSEDTLVLNITIWSSTDPYTFTRDRAHDLYT